MSKRQPEIRIVYPDASAAAMLLTEAMIKRSTGKRVVETNSAEKEYTGEQLFGGMLDCSTDTSVELTLRLNPDAMDYALAMLIAKNLTEEERRAIRMETDSMEVVNLLSPAQAAEAPGQALDGSSSPDVPSAERKQILGEDVEQDQAELNLGGGEDSASTSAVGTTTSTADETETQSFEGEIAKNRKETATLAIIFLLIDHINNKEIRIKLSDFCSSFLHPAKNVHVNIGIVGLAYLAAITSGIEPTKDSPEDMIEKLLLVDWGKYTPDKVKQLYQTNADTNQDSDIEPGLLNDLDEDKPSTAAVLSAPLADKGGQGRMSEKVKVEEKTP